MGKSMDEVVEKFGKSKKALKIKVLGLILERHRVCNCQSGKGVRLMGESMDELKEKC